MDNNREKREAKDFVEFHTKNCNECRPRYFGVYVFNKHDSSTIVVAINELWQYQNQNGVADMGEFSVPPTNEVFVGCTGWANPHGSDTTKTFKIRWARFA